MQTKVFSFRKLAMAGALLLLSACASTSDEGAAGGPRIAKPAYASWTQEDYRYRIAPGDELSLHFLVNPDLNAQVTVGPDGRGVFPLISGLKVQGMTVEQADDALTQAYAAALREPAVETLITTYGSAQIYVGGEVRTPGVVPIKGQLTVAQAIVAAGGFSPTARTGHVAIIRQRPGESRLLLRMVDVKAILGQGGDATPFAILPGDLIFVPRSKIAEVDLFVQQYITGALPFSTGVSYSTGNVRGF